MMADGRWDSATNTKFIEAYKQQVSLWDPKHPDYKNRESRYAAYRNIIGAMDMELTVKFVISKIRSLRNTYNNEMLKSKKSVTSGKSRIYKSKIPWLNSLDFLKNIDNSTRTDTDTLVHENQQAAFTFKNEEEDKESYEQYVDYKTRSSKKNKISQVTDAVKVHEKITNQHVNNNNENDEFDSFGNVVAKQLRTLPLEVALETEETILAILRKQRIKALK